MPDFSTAEKFDLLKPLVDRLHRGHCWIKTGNGPRMVRRAFTDAMLAEHCAGRKAYGLCPLAPGGDKVKVGLLDFDSHRGEVPWGEMMNIATNTAFVLEQNGYNPTLFRSSGGNGVHLYLIWDRPQDAYSVRMVFREALEAMGFKDGAGGVENQQIEVFPKQNEVPADGFGSMFVLPFAGRSEYLEV